VCRWASCLHVTLRIDTVPKVHADPFWCDLQKSAAVYAVGEVDNGNASYVGPTSSTWTAS